MKAHLLLPIGLLTAVVLTAVTPPAGAHKRDFVFTYQWWTPPRVEKEIETWLTFQPGKDKWEGQLEYEWPVTDRWVIAPYLLLEQSPGTSFRTTGWKVEQRYRFGDYANGRLLPALYAEVKKKNGEPYELEGKLLFSHDGALASAFNLIVEREMESHAKVKWGYAAGTSYALAKRWRLGGEASGNFSEDKHYAGPTLAFDVSSKTRILIGAGLGLNHKSPGRIRMLAEYEWF